MMESVSAGGQAGVFGVHIANGRTKTEWEWAQEVADKVIFIGDTAPPGIREQAHAFKEQIRLLVGLHVAEAVQHEREWCAMVAQQNGAPEAAAAAIRSR